MKVYLVTESSGEHKIFRDKPTLQKTYARKDSPFEWVGQHKLDLDPVNLFPHLEFPPSLGSEPFEAELIIRQKIDIKELKERLNGTKV